MLSAEILEKVHRRLGVVQHFFLHRRILRPTAEGDRHHVHIALGALLLHLRRSDVVGLQDARESGQADADEAGVAHHVEDVGELHFPEVAP